jgi:hypothetical protein
MPLIFHLHPQVNADPDAWPMKQLEPHGRTSNESTLLDSQNQSGCSDGRKSMLFTTFNLIDTAWFTY